MKQRNTKKTTGEFKKDVYSLVNDEYTVLGNYVTNSTKISIKHNKCNHIYDVTPGNFLNGRRCPRCFKISKLNFEKELDKKRPGEFTLISDYKNKKTNVDVRHNETGYIWNVSPRDILSNKECPIYADNVNKISTTLFKIRVGKVHENFEVLGEYVNRNIPILMRDNIHGFEFEARPSSIMKSSFTGKRNRIQKSKQFDFEEFVNTLDLDYKVLGKYINSKEKIKFLHTVCDREFEMRPNDFQQGYRCPICANDGKSKMEKELKIYIETIYDGTIIENYMDGLEIDIYIPELNIGIEFDGLYWHSNMEKDKDYHINKTNHFKEKGIRIIHVFEDEWVDKKEIVKNKISHIMGVSNEPRIYARKCTIKEIETSIKTEFLNNYHIQGSDRSSVKLGMYYGDELVSVMTFGSNRVALGGKSKNNKYELIRFASSSKYIVVGGFGKMLKYFQRNYHWDTIVTYADYRWSSDENVYEKIGFSKVRLSAPNYWYFYNSDKIRYHRYSYRKQILKEKFKEYYNEDKSEKEIMADVGMLHIYDCGNLVYEMKNND